MNGVVFAIRRFCLHDGSGIRTTVFLKGCDLHCDWCESPEGISRRPELCYDESLCNLCGACARVCPGVHQLASGGHGLNRQHCDLCGRCVDGCSPGALSVVGQRMDHAEVLDVVLRDKRYYDHSGGGLTLSGGEPMCQPEFTKALLKGAKKAGLHTILETNGNALIGQYAELSSYVDLFLIGYKLTDPKRSLEQTGGEPYMSASNIRALARLGKKLVLRCTIIPGVNDNEEHFKAIAGLSCAGESVLGAEILAHCPPDAGALRRLGRDAGPGYPMADEQAIQRWKREIEGLGGRVYER